MRALLETRSFDKLLVSLCFGLYDKRKMLEFLRISGVRQRGCGIYFISISLFGPHALRFLKAFLLVLFSSIDIF